MDNKKRYIAVGVLSIFAIILIIIIITLFVDVYERNPSSENNNLESLNNVTKVSDATPTATIEPTATTETGNSSEVETINPSPTTIATPVATPSSIFSVLITSPASTATPIPTVNFEATTPKATIKPVPTEKATPKLTIKPTSSPTPTFNAEETMCAHLWKPANCIAPKICAKCGVTDGTAIGHSWGEWTTIIAAGVGMYGQEQRICSNCGNCELQLIPPLQSDITKNWFVSQYNTAKQLYLLSLNSSLTNKNGEISTLREQASSYYVDYQREIERIKEQCASLGMSNSGYENSLLKSAEENYKSNTSVYTNKINKLKDEVSAIEAEIDNPSVDNILAIVSQNCNISSKEAREYYNKYF